MQPTSIASYLATVADSDLFGLLAIYCFVTAVLGFFEKVRSTTPYRFMAFLGLLMVPVLHIAGTYFLNQVPA